MPNSTALTGSYYFSEVLQDKLKAVLDYGLTVVEAPSGFGKTTAVREFLNTRLTSFDIHWYTCFGESSQRAWKGICELFGDCCNEVAEELRECGVPDVDNLAEIAQAVSRLNCQRPSVMVIDNYQLFGIEVQRRLIAALSMCRDQNTHIIVITQPLPEQEEWLGCHPCRYHSIDMQDLLFDSACIARYCRNTGQYISHEAIEKINNVAHGWVAAVRLHLRHYGETDRLINSDDINALVERALWKRLNEEQRRLMLGLALLENFTVRQAAIMGSGTTMPDMIAELLRLDFFVRYVSDKRTYTMHNILRSYLLQRFEVYPEDFCNDMLHKAAEACVAVEDYLQAALFLLKIKDFDAIFALPITTEYNYNNQERDITRFFKSIFDECPVEMFARYPVKLVIVAYNFFRRGEDRKSVV